MKPTTLRLLAPQFSQLSHFLVWWTFVRILINSFSSLKSCNKRYIFLQVSFSSFTMTLPSTGSSRICHTGSQPQKQIPSPSWMDGDQRTERVIIPLLEAFTVKYLDKF
jgi:hypothetical protein